MPGSEVAKETGGGVRRFLNQNPAVVLLTLAVLVAVAIAYAIASMSRPPMGRSFFTTDGGKTYYATRGLPPLSNGAVVVKLFSCDGGKTTFVGYLMKYTDQGKKSAEEMIRRQVVWPNNGYMVQKPGESEWVPAQGGAGPPGSGDSDQGRKFAEITRVKCPDGSPAMMITAQ